MLRIKEGDASEVVVEGLSFPTSIDFNDAGDAFVTINGIGAPGSGAVVRFDGLTAMTGSPLPSAGAPAPPSEAGAEPAALPETGGSPLGPGWIIVAAGLVVVMVGLALSIRQRRGEGAGSERQ